MKEVVLVEFTPDGYGLSFHITNKALYWLLSAILKQDDLNNLSEGIKKIASESKNIRCFKVKARRFLEKFFDTNRSHPLLIQYVKELGYRTGEFSFSRYDDELFECQIVKEWPDNDYEYEYERLSLTPILRRNALAELMSQGNIDELLDYLKCRGFDKEFILRD